MKTLAVMFVMIAAFALAQPVLAADNPATGGNINSSTGGNTQTTSTGGGGGLSNPLKVDSIAELLNLILDFVVTIGGIIVVLMLVVVGFRFVQAQGNSEEIIAARQMLLYTVIGALVLLGAKAIQAGIVATVNSLSV